MTFLDDHRDSYGVESICRVLPIAPSAYYEQKARQADPDRLPARTKRNRVLTEEILRVWKENFGVYGAVKVWKQLCREGFAAARCTVERLMRKLGLQGAIRGKKFKTTVTDESSARPLDLVDRDFNATRPNQLGLRLYLRRDLARLYLRGLRHRCLRSQDRGLARFDIDACGSRARCPGASAS